MLINHSAAGSAAGTVIGRNPLSEHSKKAHPECLRIRTYSFVFAKSLTSSLV